MGGLGKNTRYRLRRMLGEGGLPAAACLTATERFLIDYRWTLESVPVTQITLKYKNHPVPELGGHECLLAAIPREKIRLSALEE